MSAIRTIPNLKLCSQKWVHAKNISVTFQSYIGYFETRTVDSIKLFQL